jgi:hypothetical protein
VELENILTAERDKKNIWFEKFENFVKSDRYKKQSFIQKFFNYEFDNGKKLCTTIPKEKHSG